MSDSSASSPSSPGAALSWRHSLPALLAGGLSGLAADSITHPIDTARTRLQVERGAGATAKYRTTLGTLRTILAQEGAPAFYKGFGSVAIFTVPAHALYFSGYEASKRALGSEEPWAHFVSGLVADVCGAVLWCPQDVVKQKLQVQEHTRSSRESARYRNAVHAIARVAQEEGVFAGLYRGFGAAVLVYAPMVALHFTLYEALTARLAQRFTASRQRDDLPRAAFLGAALVSASTSALVTTPLDVVKTRLQVTSARDGGYAGIGHALASIARSEGAPAFFRGASARTLWLGPNAALCMLFYETFKQLVARAVHVHAEH